MVGRFPTHSEAKLSSQLYQDLVDRGVVLFGMSWCAQFMFMARNAGSPFMVYALGGARRCRAVCEG